MCAGTQTHAQAAISAAVLAAKEEHYAHLTGQAGIPAIDGEPPRARLPAWRCSGSADAAALLTWLQL